MLDNSKSTPIKEQSHFKRTTFKSSSSSIDNIQAEDDDDREKFVRTVAVAFQKSVPGPAGVWRRSYGDGAGDLIQPYVDHFGHYPDESDIEDLLYRCAAYGAGTWAYVAKAMSSWVSEQVASASSRSRQAAHTLVSYNCEAPDPRAATIWDDALKSIQSTVTRPLYETWLRDTAGVAWSNGIFTVEAPNDFIASMIEDRLYRIIANTLEDMLGSPVEVSVTAKGRQTNLPESE